MSGRIFINYRRGDDPGFAGRLFDRLEAAFTSDRLFMDIDSIEPGLDFVRVLEDQVDKCDVFLAVIGPNWINAKDETGVRRLENQDDFVRIEIESGLKLGKRIIPVLVNNAEMPRAEHLPESLKPLSRRNAVRLTHERFKADASGLVKQLEKALQDVEAERQAATSAAAVEAKQRAEEEAAKAAELERQEKERSRLQQVAGLSPEQIAKAEELANWDFIKDNESPQDFRDHLARFPSGVTERMARAKLEMLMWTTLGETPSLDELESFVAEFPDAKHASEANRRLAAMRAESEAAQAAEALARRETEHWASASAADDPEAYKQFLEQWPRGLHAPNAHDRLRALGTPSFGWREMLAGAAVAFSIPATIVAGGLVSALNVFPQEDILVKPSETSVFVAENSASVGALIAAVIICVLVVSIVLWRGPTRLSTFEALSYWAAFSITAMAGSFEAENLRLSSFVYFHEWKLPYYAMAVALVVASGVFLASVRYASNRGVELAVYWLGSAFAVFLLRPLLSLTGDMARAITVAVVFVTALAIMLVRRRQLSPTEISIYGAGFVLSLVWFAAI